MNTILLAIVAIKDGVWGARRASLAMPIVYFFEKSQIM